jgi:hypothetical protein
VCLRLRQALFGWGSGLLTLNEYETSLCITRQLCVGSLWLRPAKLFCFFGGGERWQGTIAAELRSLAAVAQKITTAASREEKARGWIELNRQAKKFGEEMNAAFPDTSIKGDAISPAEAQHLALTATSYGVRIAFCESGENWAADNQGYFKYLELWPNGPEADEATWMGPIGNASFCGDSEGSAEELNEFIAQRKQFLQKFPESRFAAQAKQDVTDAQAQLQEALRSGR